MSGILTVARREIRDRKMVLAAAAAFGLLPLLVPFVRPTALASDARHWTAMIFVFGFGLAAALLLGASVIVRDLVERRLGFYFSRPLSSLSIWGGKTLAGYALVLASMALIYAPTALVNLRVFPEGTTAVIWAVSLAAVILLLPLAHVLASVARSRSTWLAVDAVAAALVLSILAYAAKRYVEAAVFLFTKPNAWFSTGPVALLVALLVAGYVQVEKGRTDPVDSHRALSIALWSMLLPMSLATAGYWTWFTSPSPSELWIGELRTAPSGSWLSVVGIARGRDLETSFLVNARNGRSVRTGLSEGAALSENGERAAWAHVRLSGFSRMERVLSHVDLSAREPAPVETEFTFSVNFTPALNFSPSGKRLLIADGETISILDLDSGKTLVAVNPPWAKSSDRSHVGIVNWDGYTFTSEDTVRVVRNVGTSRTPEIKTFDIAELDIPNKKLSVTGRVETEPCTWARAFFDPAADRLVVSATKKKVTLHDGRTGALHAELLGGDAFLWSLSILSSGEFVIVTKSPSGWDLRSLSKDGRLEGTIPLGQTARAEVSGEIALGRVFVSTRRAESTYLPHQGWTTRLVDIRSGEVVRELSGLHSVWTRSFWMKSLGSPVVPPETAWLFVDETGALVRVDPETGIRSRLLDKS